MMQDPNGDGMDPMMIAGRLPVDRLMQVNLVVESCCHTQQIGALRYGNPLWTVSFSLESMIFVCNAY